MRVQHGPPTDVLLAGVTRNRGYRYGCLPSRPLLVEAAAEAGYTERDPLIFVAESYFAEDQAQQGLNYLSQIIESKVAAGEPVDEAGPLVTAGRRAIHQPAPSYAEQATEAMHSAQYDLGQKLGCGAHLSALRRTASDRFNISQALTLDAIEAMPVPEIALRLIPIYEAAPSVAL